MPCTYGYPLDAHSIGPDLCGRPATHGDRCWRHAAETAPARSLAAKAAARTRRRRRSWWSRALSLISFRRAA